MVLVARVCDCFNVYVATVDHDDAWELQTLTNQGVVSVRDFDHAESDLMENILRQISEIGYGFLTELD